VILGKKLAEEFVIALDVSAEAVQPWRTIPVGGLCASQGCGGDLINTWVKPSSRTEDRCGEDAKLRLNNVVPLGSKHRVFCTKVKWKFITGKKRPATMYAKASPAMLNVLLGAVHVMVRMDTSCSRR